MTAEDGTTIVFNGEIYNFQHLRRELESLGHVFQTASDTEVILRGYRQYGTAVSEKLRGMFAFAIYDAPKKRLFISRDRIGKKPLLYSFNNGHFVFSSEMQSLLAAGSISREIDENALDLYMGLQYIPAPQTIFRAVKKLPPTHSLILENGGLSVFPYWRLEPKENAAPMSYEEAKTAVIAKLSESVKLRMAYNSAVLGCTFILARPKLNTERPASMQMKIGETIHLGLHDYTVVGMLI